MSDTHPSVRAIVCTAHLMLLQNDKASIKDADWPPYLSLVRDWCLKLPYYWSPGMDEGTRH